MLQNIEKLFNKIGLSNHEITSQSTFLKGVYYLGLLFIFSFSLFIWIEQFDNTGDADDLIGWEEYQELITVPAQSVDYNIANIEFKEPFVSYLPKTWYVGGYSINHAHLSYIYLFLVIIAFTLILTVIHDWRGLWYYGGQLFCIVLLFSLRGDYLLLFSSTTNYFLLISIVLFLGFNYLFRFWFSGTSWINRWIIYLLITLVLFFIVKQYANCALPFYQMAVSNLSFSLLISSVFIILLAVEIPALILRYSRDGIRQFIITSLAYIALLGVTIMTSIGNLSLPYFPVNFIFLLLLSVCIGCKGFSKYLNKEIPALGSVFNLRILYISLSLMLLSVLFLEIQTANQQLLIYFERIVLYLFFSISLFFIVYVSINFYELLVQKLKVYKVLYSPKRFPFLMCLLFGLILAYFLTLIQNRNFYDYAIAGYFNTEGDLYANTNNLTLAENAYKKSLHLGQGNNHAYYAMGILKMKHNKNNEAEDFLRTSIDVKPTPQAYVNLGIINTWNGSRSLAIKYLKDGEKHFPKNHQIRNNLGLEYANLYMIDSTTNYLLPEQKNISTQKQLKEYQQELYNFIGALITLKADIITQEDWGSLLLENIQKNTLSQDNLNFEMAKIAYNNAFKPTRKNSLQNLENIDISLFKAYQLGNFLVSSILGKHPLNKELEDLLDKINLESNEKLWIKKCYAFWLFQEKKHEKAFKIMNQVASEFSESSSRANEIMGTWALYINSPRLAQYYFDKITQYRNNKIRWKKLTAAYLASDNEKINYYLDMYKNISNFLLSGDKNKVIYDKIKNVAAIGKKEEGILPNEMLNGENDAFNVEKVMEKVQELSKSGKKEEAYQLILEKLKYNRYNFSFNKIYLQLAAEQGYWFFIEKEEKEMKKLLGHKNYRQLIDSLEKQYKHDDF